MSTEMIGVDASGDERPMRPCAGAGIGCGQVDDHPRHVLDDGTDDPPMYHLDCHAAAGCAHCRQQLAGAEGATGAALLDHLAGPGASAAPAADTTPED